MGCSKADQRAVSKPQLTQISCELEMACVQRSTVASTRQIFQFTGCQRIHAIRRFATAKGHVPVATNSAHRAVATGRPAQRSHCCRTSSLSSCSRSTTPRAHVASLPCQRISSRT